MLTRSQQMAVGAVLGAMALAVLDAGAVNVALPRLAAAFHVPPADAVLIVGAYQGALLAGLLPAAHLASRLGLARLFRAGILLFGAAGLFASLAPDLPLLIVARLFQGLGGAAIMALGIAVLRAELGEQRLPQAIAWNAMNVAIGAAAGPMLGATLLHLVDPRALFAAGTPLAFIALGLASRLKTGERAAGAFDGAAIALHIATVAALLAAVRLGPASPGLAAVGAGIVVVLMRVSRDRSRRQEAPLFPFDLLRPPALALQSGASVCCFVAQSGGLIALSFRLQSPAGQGVAATGLAMACWPLSAAAASLLSSRWAVRDGATWPCAIGAAILSAGLIVVAASPDGAAWPALPVGAALCGTGFGLFQLANNNILFQGAPASRSAAVGGLQGTARLFGQTIGTLLAAELFAAVPLKQAPIAVAAVGAFAAMLAVWILLVAARASVVPDQPPRAVARAPTLQRPPPR